MPGTFISREVDYAPQQMFALVADVERYPEFVPNWEAVRVRNRCTDGYTTDQLVRLGPLRHTFTTRTTLHPFDRIEVVSRDAPFKNLLLEWKFNLTQSGQCRISLTVDFELRFRAIQTIGVILSKDSIWRLIAAFEKRAAQMYGPSQPTPHRE